MKFIQGDANTARDLLAARIMKEVKAGKRVLWLLSGGSNAPISAAVLAWLKKCLSKHELLSISATLCDERYGADGHENSNWKKLREAGFDFNIVKSLPVLKGKPFEETVRKFESEFTLFRSEADIVVGQFGVGEDGHIAGVLPGSKAVVSPRIAQGYETEQFLRITLTLETIRGVDVAFAFAFGEAKKEALEKLKKGGSLDGAPARILGKISESIIVSDVPVD